MHNKLQVHIIPTIINLIISWKLVKAKIKAATFKGKRQYPNNHIIGNNLIFASNKLALKYIRKLPSQKIVNTDAMIFDFSWERIDKVQDKKVINIHQNFIKSIVKFGKIC